MTQKSNLSEIDQKETSNWAIITPSYSRDFELCRLLCKSIDAFVVGNWHHYIIVSREDLHLFSELEGPRRSIVEKQTLLPKGLVHLPRLSLFANRLIGFKKFSLWFSWRIGLMVGWQVQQLIKIEMACRVKEIGVLCCDSDVFFVRTFHVEKQLKDGKYRFFRSQQDFEEKEQPNSHFLVSSAKILGIKGKPFPCPEYVGPLITWHRPTVQALCHHVEKVNGRDWQSAMGRWYSLSEYSIYGLFADRILGDNTHLTNSFETLCKTVWSKTEMNNSTLNDFCDNLGAHEVAICVQSFIDMPIERLERQFERQLQKQNH